MEEPIFHRKTFDSEGVGDIKSTFLLVRTRLPEFHALPGFHADFQNGNILPLPQIPGIIKVKGPDVLGF